VFYLFALEKKSVLVVVVVVVCEFCFRCFCWSSCNVWERREDMKAREKAFSLALLRTLEVVWFELFKAVKVGA
jgi:hypothetical protein